MLGVYVVVREQAMNISTPMMSCVTVVLCKEFLLAVVSHQMSD